MDFRLSNRRHVDAAKAFLRKAIKLQGRPPQTITLDGYAASHRAMREMKAEGTLPAGTTLRASKFLNNQVEQDHRGVKLRLGRMLGFKRFQTAAITIGSIELVRRIYKGQFDLGISAPQRSECILPYGTQCSRPVSDIRAGRSRILVRNSANCTAQHAEIELLLIDPTQKLDAAVGPIAATAVTALVPAPDPGSSSAGAPRVSLRSPGEFGIQGLDLRLQCG